MSILRGYDKGFQSELFFQNTLRVVGVLDADRHDKQDWPIAPAFLHLEAPPFRLPADLHALRRLYNLPPGPFDLINPAAFRHFQLLAEWLRTCDPFRRRNLLRVNLLPRHFFNPDNLAGLRVRVGEFHRLDVRLAHIHRLDDPVFHRVLDPIKANHPASRTLAVRAVRRRGRVHAHDRLPGLRQQVKNLVVFRGNGVVRLVVENGNPAKVVQDHPEIFRPLGA